MEVTTIGAHEAKAHLFKLLEQVKRGRTFLITRRGRPVAELRPVAVADRRPRYGCDRGRVRLSPDFDAPLPTFDF
ncbi:MAG: type II toxin-antitoxin system prevent-host-death family antitoxin [Planctomycetes bacterium]|nr:type II toxin-antitoxin system prevent-host-death family antitoxin [Planctomycetota bacterium]